MLTRIGKEFELAIDLAGDVPTRATDDDHTMNVASFYDLDGDGQIDAEVWVNLADAFRWSIASEWGRYEALAHPSPFATTPPEMTLPWSSLDEPASLSRSAPCGRRPRPKLLVAGWSRTW